MLATYGKAEEISPGVHFTEAVVHEQMRDKPVHALSFCKSKAHGDLICAVLLVDSMKRTVYAVCLSDFSNKEFKKYRTHQKKSQLLGVFRMKMSQKFLRR